LKLKRILVIFLLIIASFFLGIISEYFLRPTVVKIKQAVNGEYQVRLSGYKYISPLVECEAKEQSEDGELNVLEKHLSSYIKDKVSKNEIKSASVYYRDLNNGPWIGVNERAEYAPASLLKVPVLMAFFKEAEDDPTILQKKVEFKNHPNAISQNYKPKKLLKFGEKYSIEDLLEQMIVQSDNNALLTLVDAIDIRKINRVSDDLGVKSPPEDSSEDAYISVKSYASFFRVLYNASYLSKDYSEKALEYMTREGFYDGIAKGLPKGITVANKFGERKTDEFQQLHDCGIVYYPKKPYLVCIMTRGDDFSKLSTTIGDISKMIYTSVSSTIRQ